MPPVFGPWSPSRARLKSCAGSSGTAVTPSVTANRDTSGPSRNSSITTVPQSRACARAASMSAVTRTPLPAASASSLTTYGGPNAASAASASAAVRRATNAAAVYGSPPRPSPAWRRTWSPRSWRPWRTGRSRRCRLRAARRRPRRPAAPRARSPPGPARACRASARIASATAPCPGGPRPARRCPGCPARRAGWPAGGSASGRSRARGLPTRTTSIRMGLKHGGLSCRVWSRRGRRRPRPPGPPIICSTAVT